MRSSQLVRRLSKILGDPYGGPSLSVKGGEFVIYEWFDAPTGTEILARGRTLEEVIFNYEVAVSENV